MKKIILLSLMMMASLAVFANGSAEKEVEAEPKVITPFHVHEEITISGKLELGDDNTATVESNGITYYLQVPQYVFDMDQVEDGMEVTLTGVIPEMPVWAKEKTQVLIVRGGIVDGVEFTLENRGGRNGQMPMKGMQGNMNPPNNGFAPGMKGNSSKGRYQ